MDPNLVLVIVPAAAGFLGAVVGGATTYMSARAQWKRELAARRVEEAREREKAAAIRVDHILRELESDIPARLEERKSASSSPERGVRIERVHSSLEELETLVFELSQELGDRVREATSFLRHADDMGSDGYRGGFHYDTTRTIAREVVKDIHIAIVSWLRNQSLSEPSSKIAELRAAYQELIADLELEFGAEIAEEEDARKAWLQKHPEVAADLRDRESI